MGAGKGKTKRTQTKTPLGDFVDVAKLKVGDGVQYYPAFPPGATLGTYDTDKKFSLMRKTAVITKIYAENNKYDLNFGNEVLCWVPARHLRESTQIPEQSPSIEKPSTGLGEDLVF